MADLRTELQSIYDEHDHLTPDLLVQVARDKRHPLHDRVFDRPVKEAAEAYYRARAHELIVSVRITYRDADETGPEKSVRAFHAIRTEKGHVYEPVEKIASDDFSRTLLLRDMEREWRQLYDRYEQFGEFLTMIREDIGKIAA
jgi:hypothetical protein